MKKTPFSKKALAAVLSVTVAAALTPMGALAFADEPVDPAPTPNTPSIVDPTPTPDPEKPATTPISKATVKLAKEEVTFTGAAITPGVIVTYKGAELVKGVDYKLAYSQNKNAGMAKVKLTGLGAFNGTKTVNFKILKKKVTPKVKAPKVVKAKKSKTQAVAKVKAVTKRAATYTKVSGSSKIVVKKDGTIVAKKGLQKGLHKVKVRVVVKESANYKAATKTVVTFVKVA
ncbi:MAG: hypothetical protein Q4D06_06090 [Coriobacteriia bacterium]|nr:hypothetical protein [Coriobacteriia bacterium]